MQAGHLAAKASYGYVLILDGDDDAKREGVRLLNEAEQAGCNRALLYTGLTWMKRWHDDERINSQWNQNVVSQVHYWLESAQEKGGEDARDAKEDLAEFDRVIEQAQMNAFTSGIFKALIGSGTSSGDGGMSQQEYNRRYQSDRINGTTPQK
jgi:hypothetical protein